MSESRQVEADDGTTIAWRESGNGPVLILVHGAVADARQWDRLVPLLADDFTVVAMDRRGRGRSGAQGPSYASDTDAADVVALAGAVDGPVHLFGHSSGARYALQAATGLADLASLMLYEPPEERTVPDSMLERIDRQASAGDRVGVLRSFFVDAVGNDEEAFASLRQRPVWPMMLDNALTLPAELRAGSGFRLDPDDLDGLDVPVRILVGGLSDPELDDTAHQVAAGLPSADVAVLDGQGHGAMVSAPALLAAEIRRFILETR